MVTPVSQADRCGGGASRSDELEMSSATVFTKCLSMNRFSDQGKAVSSPGCQLTSCLFTTKISNHGHFAQRHHQLISISSFQPIGNENSKHRTPNH